jgi:hypothetical protein
MMPNRRIKSKQSELLAPLPGGIQERARAKVGASAVSQLVWLIELLNRSEESIALGTEQERGILEAEIVAFAERIGQPSAGKSSILSPKEMIELFRDIRASILAIFQGAPFEIRIPAVSYMSADGGPPIYMGNPEALFRLAVTRLLETERERIEICARPGCDNLFVRRKRGLYCSLRCSQLEQFKRYVARNSPAE